MNNGCIAANYVESTGAETTSNGMWVTNARNLIDGSRSKSGTGAGERLRPVRRRSQRLTGIKTEHHHALSKGVHLIVDRLSRNKRVLTLFASDGRMFFVIPMGARSCIGTTDTRVDTPYRR